VLKDKNLFIKWTNKSVRVESEEINIKGYKDVASSLLKYLW